MLDKNVKPLDDKFILLTNERAALLESKIERANAQIESMIAQIEAAKRIRQNSK